MSYGFLFQERLTALAPLAGRYVVGLLLVALLPGCGVLAPTRSAHPPGYPVGYAERGLASWYGPGFHGKRTSSGEVFNMHALTAAHRTLPFGSVAVVTSRTTRRRVTVRINDRGPFVGGRIVDLSHAAARALGMTGVGTDEIELRVVAYKPGGTLPPLRVQVGSFSDESRARALARRLTERYADVRTVIVDLADGRRFRVQVGRFEAESRAAAVADEIERTFHVSCLVVRDDV